MKPQAYKILFYFGIVVAGFFVSGSIIEVHAQEFTLPVVGNCRITQPPGGSTSHYTTWDRYAWDIARVPGEYCEPAAVADGVVEVVSARGPYGLHVWIRHDNGLRSLYAHLQSTVLSEGVRVSQGAQIGVMGATGRVTGVHVHFALHPRAGGGSVASDGLIDFTPLIQNTQQCGIRCSRASEIFYNNIVPTYSGFVTQFEKREPGKLEKIQLKDPDIKPIADLVEKAYDRSFAIGAVIGLTMLMYGGIIYIASAGNPGRKSDAIEWIKAAIMGLLLLLAAYFILNLINPCLVGSIGPGC